MLCQSTGSDWENTCESRVLCVSKINVCIKSNGFVMVSANQMRIYRERKAVVSSMLTFFGIPVELKGSRKSNEIIQLSGDRLFRQRGNHQIPLVRISVL